MSHMFSGEYEYGFFCGFFTVVACLIFLFILLSLVIYFGNINEKIRDVDKLQEEVKKLKKEGKK